MTWHDPAKLMTVEHATAVLQEMQDRRTAAEQRGCDLAAEREAIAFAAHGSGDAKAKKRPAEIHQSIAVHGSELDSLDAAISAAQRHLANARAAVQREARRADARRALELTNELRAAETLSGEALVAFVARYQKVQQIAADLNRLGIGSPRADVVRVNAERTIGQVL